MASAVRLVFLQPAYLTPLLSYYAIAHLSISGHCQCFGHASTCIGEVTQLAYLQYDLSTLTMYSVLSECIRKALCEFFHHAILVISVFLSKYPVF